MQTKTRSRLIVLLVLLSFALSSGPLLLMGRAEPADPAGGARVGQARSLEQIIQDINSAGAEVRGAISTPSALFDEVGRRATAPKAMPPLRKMVRLFDEMIEAHPGMAENLGAGAERSRLVGYLSLLGDAESAARLEKEAGSADPGVALPARSMQLLVRWWKAPTDAAEQEKVIAALKELAKAHAMDEGVAETIMAVVRQGAASPELREKAEEIILTDLQGPAVEGYAEEIAAGRKLRGLEDKPLVLEGVKVDGSKFSTAEWKGKVILVDFWATWCGPCVAELPQMKKVYQAHHAEGLEILGISSDPELDDLREFLAQQQDMPWPQLVDPGRRGLHRLADEYGVTMLPTMFLIDRKGIVRTVEARINYEEKIPKLLAEKAE